MVALRAKKGGQAVRGKLASRRRSVRRKDRGAVLVEAAIAIPLLCTLAFGVLEFGMLISEHHEMSSAIRAAVRVASTSGSASTADHDTLQAMHDSQGLKSIDSLDKIVVYKANGDDGLPVGGCAQGQAVPGQCNVYLSSDINLSSEQLAKTGRSDSWPAESRVAGIDYVGVYAVADHKWLTGLFPTNGTTVSESAVMRLDPDTLRPWMPPNGVTDPVTVAPTTIAPTTTTKKPKPTTTTQLTTTTTRPTTTTQRTTTTTAKVPKPTTTTTAKPTTTTAKPTTTTTAKPKNTTTTQKPTTTTTAKPKNQNNF